MCLSVCEKNQRVWKVWPVPTSEGKKFIISRFQSPVRSGWAPQIAVNTIYEHVHGFVTVIFAVVKCV